MSKCHAGDFFGEPYAASPGAVLNISVAAALKAFHNIFKTACEKRVCREMFDITIESNLKGREEYGIHM